MDKQQLIGATNKLIKYSSYTEHDQYELDPLLALHMLLHFVWQYRGQSELAPDTIGNALDDDYIYDQMTEGLYYYRETVSGRETSTTIVVGKVLKLYNKVVAKYELPNSPVVTLYVITKSMLDGEDLHTKNLATKCNEYFALFNILRMGKEILYGNYPRVEFRRYRRKYEKMYPDINFKGIKKNVNVMAEILQNAEFDIWLYFPHLKEIARRYVAVLSHAADQV